MSSALPSSSNTPPRGMIPPALPVLAGPARPRGPTPPTPSPVLEQEGEKGDLGLLTVGNRSNGPGSTTTTPPLSAGAKDPAVVQDVPLAVTPAPEDDVFVSTPQNGPLVLAAAPNAIAQRIVHNLRPPVGPRALQPRPDRVSELPTARNAQGIFPPEALIFVANLSSQRTAEQLELSCHQVFDQFGTCHIFIKYDPRQHPFAFVQFENVEDANNAIVYTTNLVLHGRKIRLERGKAERSVILSKKDGTAVTELEARRLLDRYGRIDLCVPANSRNNNLDGMYIKFAFYLDCQDALKGHPNTTSPYTLVIAPAMEPRLRAGPNGSPMVRGFHAPRSTVDTKSIFVGNLPETVTRHELETMFREFGRIIQVNVIRKNFTDGATNVFAFIEYASCHEADRAALAERNLHGNKLRVEPKEYSVRRPSRVAASTNSQYNHGARDYSYDDATYNTPAAPTMYNATPAMYHMNPLATPPHHGYNSQGLGMQGYGHNAAQAMQYHTPPSAGFIQRMLPAGMFTPTPPQSYGYTAQAWGSGQYGMGSIQEYPEEGHY
ncbi:hypothetical protein LTR99_006670 [Exophiala xenobiotica]|uniref:RRM domain-containing protein n=1 Tax=Vermiconidia calcicola TaxID=1690605 RepID=A0AAV9Q940_9PEZI|nr:hypothetical protein H2202_010394 [Exophiala xenobiotica]KAK5533719.1 hypothetical protein LTR23_009099 [Chaetothyriales sp. CCFEE 6169]KAK5537839.1 hypothetical protein LTR25_005091 [Vermiconidia calcicola]KAK5205267.1 hypothetical protein LTR41_009116 [Exophiala xenobiotica]KAK5267479.1 hypothetical protein LTR96_007512 [Exophiala xenobiotica]